jgi:hypothetical protein
MSYESKYREWVEKHTRQESGGKNKSEQIYQVYRGVPVFRVKLRDDPPRYRFLSPLGRARKYDRLREKIDNRLDKTPDKEKASRRSADTDDSKASYFQKWQNCQLELSDMKKREATMLAKLEEFQIKFNELDMVKSQLQKEVTDLRALVADLKNQLEVARAEINKKK